jgi:hypothetical protein
VLAGTEEMFACVAHNYSPFQSIKHTSEDHGFGFMNQSSDVRAINRQNMDFKAHWIPYRVTAHPHYSIWPDYVVLPPAMPCHSTRLYAIITQFSRHGRTGSIECHA